MLKRPSSPATLPPTKRLSSRHLVLLPDDETLEGLKTWFKNFVLPDVAGKDVTEEKFEFYNAIYWKVREIHKGERFLTEEEFRANLELERHNFFAVLKRAFTEFASLADMGDIVSHSKLRAFERGELVMNVCQVYFGRLGHPTPLVSSQTQVHGN